MEEKNSFESFEEQSDEINLLRFVNIAIRNKKYILFFTFVGAVLSVIQSFTSKPIYKGEFKIIISPSGEKVSQSNSINSFILDSVRFNNLATQIEILKSPVVLKPVFEYVKNKKGYDSDSSKNYLYKNWLNKNINVDLESGTSVVKVTYKDNDKKLIMDSLNMISDKYQNYSKQLKNKELSSTLNFVNQQIKEKKSQLAKSLEDLNKYVLDNNLGTLNIGNFFNDSLQNNDFVSGKFTNNTSIDLGGDKQNSQEFDKFDLLRKLEADYVLFSTTLTNESSLLRTTENKIRQLKEELKKPTETILSFNQKKRDLSLEFEALKRLESTRLLTQIDLAMKKNPWQLIYEPSIDPTRVSPRRKEMTFLGTLLAFVLSYLGIFIYEAKLKRIYELSDFKRIFGYQFLNNLVAINPDLSNQILDKIVQKSNSSKEKQIGFFIINDIYQQEFNNNRFELIFKRDEFKYLKLFSEIDFNKYSGFIVLLDNNYISKKSLNFYNQYFGLFKEKILGWLYVE